MSSSSSSKMLTGSTNLLLTSSLKLKEIFNLLSNTEEPNIGAEDPQYPPCTVYLYTRPIDNTEGKGAPGAEHWALYFDWGYYSATFDANEDNGILTPFSHEGEPVAPNNLTFDAKVVKENLKVEPYAVAIMAKQNKYSGKSFKLVTANCQIWAQELARLLGFELPPGQVEQVTDITLKAAVCCGVVSSAAIAVKKNKQ